MCSNDIHIKPPTTTKTKKESLFNNNNYFSLVFPPSVSPSLFKHWNLLGKYILFIFLGFSVENNIFSPPLTTQTKKKERKNKYSRLWLPLLYLVSPSSSHFSWVTFSPSGRYKNQIANAKHSLHTQITRILWTPWSMVGRLNITCHLMQLSFNERRTKKKWRIQRPLPNNLREAHIHFQNEKISFTAKKNENKNGSKQLCGYKNVVTTMQGQWGLKVDAKQKLPITMHFLCCVRIVFISKFPVAPKFISPFGHSIFHTIFVLICSIVWSCSTITKKK